MRAYLYKGDDCKLFEGKEDIKAAEKDGWLDSPDAKPKKKASVKKASKKKEDD